MKIKFSPVYIPGCQETSFCKVDEDTIIIDECEFKFDRNSIIYPDIYEISEQKILKAFRDEKGELYIEIVRIYNNINANTDWDTGQWENV